MALGRKTGGGSRKGVPNKATKALKDMILGALDQVGGEDWLIKQAKANPVAFMTLIGKVLPTQITGDPKAPLALTEIRRTIVHERTAQPTNSTEIRTTMQASKV